MTAPIEVRSVEDAKKILRAEVIGELVHEIEEVMKETDANVDKMPFMERCAYRLVREATVSLLEYLKRW